MRILKRALKTPILAFLPVTRQLRTKPLPPDHRQPASRENGSIDNRRKIAISNNLGGVKMFSSTLRHALPVRTPFRSS